MFTLKNLPKRIASKIAVHDGCWIWTGAHNSRGYGSLGVDGKSHLAHRFVYALAYGPIPQGMTLDHMCENKSCVHPYHLNVETGADNTRLRFTRDLEPARLSEPLPALVAFIDAVKAGMSRRDAMSATGRADDEARRHALHAAVGCSCAEVAS